MTNHPRRQRASGPHSKQGPRPQFPNIPVKNGTTGEVIGRVVSYSYDMDGKISFTMDMDFGIVVDWPNAIEHLSISDQRMKHGPITSVHVDGDEVVGATDFIFHPNE